MDKSERKTRDNFNKEVWALTDPNPEHFRDIYMYLNVSLSRVIEALKESTALSNIEGCGHFLDLYDWQLLNEDGSECTADDQSIETIEKLLILIKQK